MQILNTVLALANSVALASESFSQNKLLIQKEKRSFGQIVSLTRSFNLRYHFGGCVRVRDRAIRFLRSSSLLHEEMVLRCCLHSNVWVVWCWLAGGSLHEARSCETSKRTQN